MSTVFETNNYKSYLQSRLGAKGAKTEFAKHLGCQPSFLSQVLCGSPSLSLEQGVLANDYFEHSKAESRHFLALLQLERAGSARLKLHFQNELKQSLEEHRRLTNRLERARELDEAARATYYSSWAYGAVHVLSSLPCADQLGEIQEHTGLNAEDLSKVLRFLAEHGLITRRDGVWRPAQTRIHLPDCDPLVMNHHRNFRARAMQEMQLPKDENLHYSLLMAISRPDSQRIRDLILRLVEDTDKIMRPSPEEVAVQLNLDFFAI